MLNLSPNHLDRHPGLEAYAQAKRQIFRNQRAQDFAILNADDPWVSALRTVVPSQTVPFSRQRELAHGVFVAGGKICYRVRHLERVLFETRDVTLRGSFNLENVLAATAAACTLGADFAAIRKAVREFQAVEHRLEFVREIQGVDFYNNSKATSVDATAKSLEAFERGVHLILGGKDKGAPYTPLLPLIKERARTVLLIGAAAPVIAAQLAGGVELLQAGDLATAVREAFLRARPGDTVLLAPACSSFDQFKDYEQRGRLFKELVKQLAGEVAAGSLTRPKTPGGGAQERLPAPMRLVQAVEPAVAGKPWESPQPIIKPPPQEKEATGRAPLPKAPEPPESEPAAVTAQEPVTLREDYPEAFAPPAPPPENAAPTSFPAEEPAGAEIAQSPAGDGGPESPVEASEPPSEGEATAYAAPVGDGPRPLVPAAPPFVELRYVYEVDAIEMPAMESQVAPEAEPVILQRASGAEVNGDEPLPFEVRVENREGATPPPGRKGSAKRKGRGKAEDRQGSPPPSSKPRSRLPGMD
jgi:hypothetical protein